jgi:hypothetical protein
MSGKESLDYFTRLIFCLIEKKRVLVNLLISYESNNNTLIRICWPLVAALTNGWREGQLAGMDYNKLCNLLRPAASRQKALTSFVLTSGHRHTIIDHITSPTSLNAPQKGEARASAQLQSAEANSSDQLRLTAQISWG